MAGVGVGGGDEDVVWWGAESLVSETGVSSLGVWLGVDTLSLVGETRDWWVAEGGVGVSGGAEAGKSGKGGSREAPRVLRSL